MSKNLLNICRGKQVFLFLWILVFGMCAKAQSLQSNYGVPTSAVNVGNGALVYKIRINGSASVCAGPSDLTITLPPGFVYVSGSASITGGSGAVSQVSASGNVATLAVSNIPVAPDSTIISYQAYAGCGVIGSISNNINYSLAGCSGAATATATVNAQNAQLNITGVTNPSYTGAPGIVYPRAITITNAGYGAIDTFYIDSRNGQGLSVISFVPTANVTMTKIFTGTDTIYRYRIVKAGGLLSGETFTVTEQVKINCTSGGSLQSILKTWYGYGAVECTAVSNSSTAGASIDPNFRPLLVFTPLNSGGPICRGSGARDTFLIVNTGTAAAAMPRFYISSNNNEYPANGIDFFNYSGGASTNFPLPGGSAVLGIDMTSVQFKLGANGTWSNVPADSIVNQGTVLSSNGTPLANSCFGTNDKAGVFVHLPTIQPGDTVYFSFQEKNCNFADCQVDYQGALNLGAEFGDACNNRLRTFWWRFASANFGTLAPTDVPTDVNPGDVFTLSYNVNAQAQQYYITGTGKLRFVITLPSAFTWTGSMADVTYISACFTPYDATVSYDAGTHVIVYEFTPIIASTCMLAAYIQFKNVSVLPAVPSGAVTISHEVDIRHNLPCTDYYKLSCGQSPPIRIHNTAPGSCTGLVPTGVITRRTNYGEADNNNDGITDPSGTLDMNLVKTRFVMTGDTLEVTFKGKVAVNGFTPAGGFKYGAIHTSYTSYTEKMQPIHAVINLYDATGAAVGNETTSFTLAAGISTVNFTIDDLKDLMPGRSTFLDNDSIVIKKYFKIIPQNIATDNDNGEFLAQVNLNTNFYVSNVADATGADQYSCDNYGGQFTMVSHRVAFYVDPSFTVGCSPGGMYVHVYSWVGGSAPFIYEHRATILLDTMRLTLATGLTYVNSNYTPLDPLANPLVFVPTPVTPAQAISETTDYLFYVEALAKCDVPSPTGLLNNFEAIYRKLPLFDSRFRLLGNQWFYAYKTMLTIESPGVTQTVNTAAVSWDVQVNNLDVQANSGINGTVPNLWLTKSNGVSGVVIDSIQLLNGPGGTSAGLLTAVNGIYQAGVLTEATSKYFRIFAHSTNCANDSLEIIYGYKCDAYPAGLAEALANCPKGLKLYVIGQAPALQLSIINQPTGSVNLCQDMPYEVEVINSGLGTANTLNVTIPLPPGLEYVPGTYGIQYPVPGSYTTLNDANVNVIGSNLVFTIPAANIASFTGSDKYRIRFTLRTGDCSFTSGQALVFIPNGDNGCGNAIAGTAATTNRINLNGVPANLPSFSITSSADPVLACGTGPATTNYKFKIINTGSAPTSTADGFRINIPAPWTSTGITYSHNPSGAVLSGTTGIANDFSIGAGLVAGDSIVLTLALQAPDMAALPCGPMPFTESGFVSFSTTCISTGVVCSIKQLLVPEHTGTMIDVQRPSYSVSGMTATSPGNRRHLTGSFTLTNANSIFIAQNATLNVYHDANGNGVADAGDRYIGMEVFPMVNQAVQNFNYDIEVPANMGNVCPLVATLTLGCNCSPITVSIPCTGIILPVKLVSFAGKSLNCNAVLSWKTAEEANAAYMEVQRYDGTMYTVIGRVNARGSNSSYAYTDASVNPGRWQYRLRIVDKDGNEDYSSIISVPVICNNPEMAIAVYPNPVSDKLMISGIGPMSTLKLYTAAGQQLTSVVPVSRTMEMDMTKYPSGTYFLKVINADGLVRTIKVIKR